MSSMSDETDNLMLRFRTAVEKHGERLVMRALLDTQMDIGYAEQIVSGRYNASPRGANRNILESVLETLEAS